MARLPDAVRRASVQIFEATTVVEIGSGRLTTGRGTARALVLVRATEGHTATLPGARRDLLPMYSLMVSTAPLPEVVGVGSV